MSNLDLTSFAFCQPHKEACKGVFGRYLKTAFAAKGSYVRLVEDIRPLVQMSCTGCIECGGILDDLREFPDRIEIAEDVVHGDIVFFSTVIDSRDWETGYVDDYHLLVNKYVATAAEHEINTGPVAPDLIKQEKEQVCSSAN